MNTNNQTNVNYCKFTPLRGAKQPDHVPLPGEDYCKNHKRIMATREHNDIRRRLLERERQAAETRAMRTQLILELQLAEERNLHINEQDELDQRKYEEMLKRSLPTPRSSVPYSPERPQPPLSMPDSSSADHPPIAIQPVVQPPIVQLPVSSSTTQQPASLSNRSHRQSRSSHRSSSSRPHHRRYRSPDGFDEDGGYYYYSYDDFIDESSSESDSDSSPEPPPRRSSTRGRSSSRRVSQRVPNPRSRSSSSTIIPSSSIAAPTSFPDFDVEDVTSQFSSNSFFKQ